MAASTTTAAWSFTANGPPRSVLSLSPVTLPPFPPVPTPEEEYILVATSFAALNPGDLFTMHLIPSFARCAGPTVPGLDLVGTVEAVHTPSTRGDPSSPTHAARFAKGDRVV